MRIVICRVFLPSLISCLPRESMKAVAGSDIFRRGMSSTCQAEMLIRHDLAACCATVRIGFLTVIIKRERLPPTESANSPTTRLGLPVVIIRWRRLSSTESAVTYGAAVVGAFTV